MNNSLPANSAARRISVTLKRSDDGTITGRIRIEITGRDPDGVDGEEMAGTGLSDIFSKACILAAALNITEINIAADHHLAFFKADEKTPIKIIS